MTAVADPSAKVDPLPVAGTETQLALQDAERERSAILGQPYSTELSRRLEELDDWTDRVWAALGATTVRSYGDES